MLSASIRELERYLDLGDLRKENEVIACLIRALKKLETPTSLGHFFEHKYPLSGDTKIDKCIDYIKLSLDNSCINRTTRSTLDSILKNLENYKVEGLSFSVQNSLPLPPYD